MQAAGEEAAGVAQVP